MIPRDVPCNGCTACCRGTRIALHPTRGDHPHEHAGNVVIDRGGWTLKHKPGTDECVYLLEDGCALYGNPARPIECRAFDCRVMAAAQRWRAGPLISQSVVDAARARA